MSNTRIRIGTRGSKLALWQAEHVSHLLQKSGIDTDIVTIETKGDKILDVSISKIGSKGVFTEEIEEQLQLGNIDIAVHSAKDMPSNLPEGFSLIAFTEREVVNDVLISSDKGISLNDKSLVLGTSSTRRVATLKKYYPHVRTVSVRGNLQTRIAKMESGQCHGLLLAYAGVHRMGYEDLIAARLSLEEFTPAVGQGSIAIEVAGNLSQEKKDLIRKSVNHQQTEIRLLAERAFLRKLQGGCSIPVFALATIEGDQLTINAGIISLDGNELVRKELSGHTSHAEELGSRIGDQVLQSGGADILYKIKQELNRQ